MPDPERVAIEVADHVASVRMTRAGKHNGLDFAMFEALGEAIDELGAEPGVRAVVLSGDGPSFCAGLDFASFLAEGRPVDEMLARRDGEPANLAQRAAYGWQALPVPVIAAVQGNCLGGGAQIALACDIRIAAPDLQLSVMEIKWGLVPDMSITQSLPRLVGVDVAKELTWTGRTVDAAEAERLGLVTRIADEPLAAAHELAAEIATKSPDAIRRGKQLLDGAWRAAAAEGLALEEQLQRELLGSPNQGAAVQAAISGEPASYADPEPG